MEMQKTNSSVSKGKKSSKLAKRNKKTAKRKSQISQEYKDNEREVSRLLEFSNLTSGIDSDSEDDSDRFFYGSAAKSEYEWQDIELGTNEAVGSYSPLKSESSTGGDVLRTAGSHTSTTLAATFIQVDSEDYTDLVKWQKFKFGYKSKQLMYKPALNICSISSVKWKNSEMMINRYKEEAKARKCQISFFVLRALQHPIDAFKLYEDETIYRTWCAVSFKPILIEPTKLPIEVPNRRFLTIDLMQLRFTQHPGLLEEHRLANSLELLCEEYQQRLIEKITERLYANLQIERNILKELFSSASDRNFKSEPERKMKDDVTRRIQLQLKKVKMLREQLYKEEAKNKQMLENILNLWLQLRRLRQNQNRQYTRLKLRIKVESLNDAIKEARQKSWNERYQADLNEIYREKLEQYYRSKRVLQEKIEQQGDGVHIPSLEKPKRPKYLQLSIQVKQHFAECFQNPEEPRIEIFYSLCQREKLADVPAPRKQQSFFVRLYFDEQIVGESRTYRLEPDLCIDIKEKIGVLINRRVPKNIYLKLYKKSRVGVIKKLDNLKLPLELSSSGICTETQTTRLNFASSKRKLAGYLRLQVLQHDEPERLPKERQLQTEFPDNKQTPSPLHSNDKLMTIKKQANKADADHLDDGSFSSSSNEELEQVHSKGFTCTFEEDLLNFADVRELYTNQRWNILNSRYLRNDSRTRDLKCVPILDHEIEFDWQQETDVIDFGSWMDPIDVHKHEGKKHLRSLYNAIQDQCQRLTQNQTYRKGNLLLNDEPLSWSSLFYTLKLVFQPRLGYNSYPSNFRSTTNQPIAKDMIQNFRIVCNVIRATGIPVRITSKTRAEDGQDKQDTKTSSPHSFFTQHLKYTNVRPFIALSYADNICRTRTAEGSNPTWNEQLMLQVKGSLADLKDDVKLCVFDEIIENKFDDDNSIKGAVDVFQSIQNNWLGEYRIPIRALLKQQKFEAIFEVNTPKILLGYKRPALETPTFATDTNAADVMLETLPAIKETLRLWCCISLEPCFQLPSLAAECLPTSELEEINQYLNEWGLQAKEIQPLRYMDPLLCTFEGRRICLTRLMHPLIPPSLQISENELNNVCRYVSLISLLKFYDPCMNLDGIWMNNEVPAARKLVGVSLDNLCDHFQILLDTTWGSPKDLGVLLCNYLLHLGFKCWLVFGVCVPHGETVFVLYISIDTMELMLIDPSTGKRYSIKDVFCPLQSIRMIAAQDKFYLNIQRDARVATMNFNFQDSTCWLPAFSKRNPAPLAGFHNITYAYRHPMDVQDLQVNIERKIMKKFSAWRGLRKTIWNRAFQSHLVSLLVDLDRIYYDQGAVNANETECNALIGNHFPNYKVFGFTMNFSYTSLNQISDCIKMTSLHSNADSSVEFALATHINAYANNLLSVWIFLLSAVPVD